MYVPKPELRLVNEYTPPLTPDLNVETDAFQDNTLQVDSQNSSAPTLRSGGEGGVYSFTSLSYGLGAYKTLHGIYLQTFVPHLP